MSAVDPVQARLKDGLFWRVWSDLYRVRAAVAYALLLTLPLIFTLNNHTFRVNRGAGLVLAGVALAMATRFDRRWLEPPVRQRIGGLFVFFGLFFVAWQWQNGDLWLNSQMLLYCGVAATFPVTLHWFRHAGSDALRYAFVWKLAGVIGATVLMVLAIMELESAGLRLLVREPPIYRDARHFNHDQFAILALIPLFALASRSRMAGAGWFAVSVLIAYPLVWSSGRAAIGALFIFACITVFLRILPLRSIGMLGLAVALATVLVFVTGRAELLLIQFGRIGEGADVVTSGRLQLWMDTLAAWSDSWSAVIFGIGPDAMRMVIRAKIGFPPVVQPHSVPIQVLTEFGVIGFVIFVAGLVIVGRRILAVLFDRTASREVRVAGAMLAAFGAYMFVDGILYHAIPLIIVMMLTAYLFHEDRRPAADAVHR